MILSGLRFKNEDGKVRKKTKKLSSEDNCFGLRSSFQGNVLKPNE